MKTLTCTCGKSAQYDIVGGSIADISNQTGFFSVWDVSNGLDSIWICEDCAIKIQILARLIQALLGGKRSIHFSGLINLVEKRQK